MCVTNNIKKVRIEKNISQEDLAEAIQCSTRTISRYETSDRNPSLELALRLAKYLQLSVNELFMLTED